MLLLDLPASLQSQDFLVHIKGNIKRLQMFLNKIVNPISICKLIQRVDAVIVDEVEVGKQPLKFKSQKKNQKVLPPPSVMSIN